MLPAVLLVAGLLALAATGCGGTASALSSSASASSAASSGTAASPHTSPSASTDASSAAATPLQVKAIGRDAVLLRTRRPVSFTFDFVGDAPAEWVWRVRSFNGDAMATGQGEAGATTATLTWDGTSTDGAPADPGEYLIEVGPGKDVSPHMTTVGWVRLQPPVKARVYNSLPAAGHKVALTFDDGGGATAWYWILRALRDGHAKGTFFPIGQYVGDYANKEAGLTIKDGMAIGSHSWSHPDLTKLSDAKIKAQLKQTDDVWWNDFKASTVPYLRPPYGAYNQHVIDVAGQMGYSRIIMWDVDSGDWTNPGENAIVRNVLSNVSDGSIIVLHTRGKAPKALPRIIAGLNKMHYEMVTIPELFQAAGIK